MKKAKKMNWAPILHGVAAIAGTLGILALLAAWIVRDGTFFGLSQAHYFEDAKGLLLVSIAFGIGTLIHLHGQMKK